MIVPIPPMEVAAGMPNSNALDRLAFLSRVAKIGLIVAIIIAVVAVLLINIDISAVININPQST